MNKKNLHPKYIFVWLLLVLMRLSSNISLKNQFRIGKKVGLFFMFISSKQRKIAYKNISICFPEKNKYQVELLVRKSFESLGISYFEIANALYMKNEEIAKLINKSNIEKLTELVHQNKRIIILTAHFTTMILGGRALLLSHNIAASYRPQKNVLFEKIYRKNFMRFGAMMIDNKNMRQIVKAFISRMPLWIVPDQDMGSERSVFAPFFGIDTATITSPARLAQKEDATVIPFIFIRNKNGYEIKFEKPLSNFPTGNLLNDTSTINKVFERQINDFPEQYFWMHPRFRTRPNGEKSFYDEKN